MKTTWLMGALLLGLAACGSDHPAVQCEVSANCNLHPDGLCETYAPTGNKWCTYPDSTCPSGRRWSDFDTGDGLSDMCVAGGDQDASVVDASPADAQAAVDAGTPDATADAAPQFDAAPGTAFDVVYAAQIEIGPNTSFGIFTGELMVINKGTNPLQIATLTVAVAAQPGENMVFEFTEENHGGGTVVLDMDEAFGALDPTVLQSMVSETVVASGNIAKVIVSDVPTSSSNRPRTVGGAISTITINGATAVLPLDVVLVSGSSGSKPAGWTRVSTP